MNLPDAEILRRAAEIVARDARWVKTINTWEAICGKSLSACTKSTS